MAASAGSNSLMDQRVIQLGSVFTPVTPIRDADLFAGRQNLLLRLVDAVNQPGRHCILFGERGVGKTSLANILRSIVSNSAHQPLVIAATNCDTADNYATLMHKLTEEITTVRQIAGAGLSVNLTEEREPLSINLPSAPRPNDLRRLLQSIDAESLLIIDEFDRLTDQDSIRLLTDTIKTFSDSAVPATLVLVGVADSVEQLVQEHQSIERCLSQVHIPRMTVEELTGIVDKGLAQVAMQMDDAVRWYIPSVSQGYPHYTHLLALKAARKAASEGRTAVVRNDIDSSIDEAILDTEHSIQEGYLKAVYSANPAALHKQVLLACGLAETDDLNYFNAQSVREPLSRIMGRDFKIPAFSKHLDAFCQAARGPVLFKEGQPRRYRYRFAVPLLRPYVLLKGISERLIQADDLRPN